MKKILSIILLISMLLSMVLILPSSAASDEESNENNLALGITNYWRWSMKGGNKSKTPLAFDGNKSHSICDGNQTICIQPQGYATATYDINGLKSGSNKDEIKYIGIVGWPLPGGKATVDTIRIYLNDIHEDGSSCKWMPDALDIAVSPDGTAGSWQIVYSEDNIRCEEKFKIYEDEDGAKTAYIEAKFFPTEITHFEICLRVARCPHMTDSAAVTNAVGKATMRITEIEVLEYQELDTTYRKNAALGATVPARPLGFTPTGYGYGLDYTDKAVDGYRGYYADGTTTGSTTTQSIAASILGNLYFDIDGKACGKNGPGAKYQGYVTYQFTRTATIEAIRLYLGRLLDDGNPYNYMANGLDVAISKTGEAGSWKVVYSANKIADDGLYQVYETEDGQKIPYVEARFDPTEAKFIRIAITDPSSKFATNATEKRYFHINEIEAWTVEDRPEEGGKETEDTAINSLMLFPLLMRHRQYETETSTTMFGLRVKHLLRSADAITFEKNGVKVDIPAATLKALNLAGSDKLVVTIVGEQVTVTVNGKAVDIEGIASSTPAEPEEEKGTTYRWDFDDLNEKNGLNNLTDSALSTKSYKFEDGMIVIDDRTTDFKMAETISLSPYTDWSIEWRAQLNNASALFGTETSKQNFVYIAYTVSGWGLPFRMVDANNKALMIKQGDYAARNTEMNTWKAEYSSAENRLTLKFFNESTQEWETVGAGTPPAFTFELTHMFGRYDPETNVCLNGKVDYVEVFIGE